MLEKAGDYGPLFYAVTYGFEIEIYGTSTQRYKTYSPIGNVEDMVLDINDQGIIKTNPTLSARTKAYVMFNPINNRIYANSDTAIGNSDYRLFTYVDIYYLNKKRVKNIIPFSCTELIGPSHNIISPIPFNLKKTLIFKQGMTGGIKTSGPDYTTGLVINPLNDNSINLNIPATSSDISNVYFTLVELR